MRIVLITSKLRFEDDGSPIGGSVVDLHLKAKGLVDLGHDVSVVTAFFEMNRIPCALPYRVFPRRIRGRGLFGLQCGVYMLLREFENQTDVFYVDGHMFLYGAGAYRVFGGRKPVAAFFNVRLNLWADVSMTPPRLSLYRRVKKGIRRLLESSIGLALAGRLDACIFNTPHIQKIYRDFGVGTRTPSAVIQDFVATKELAKRFGITDESIRIHQQQAKPLIVLSTGRMIPEKGFDLLLRSFSKVKDKQNYTLILSGGGPERKRLEMLSEELGIRSRVQFPGWIPRAELYRLFAQAHLFVFPKWWIEYGSAVLTEALAFGLPSIVPGGGALEWLSGGSALTFCYDKNGELAEQLVRLGHDERLRVELGEKALRQSGELDYRTLSARLEKVLAECATLSKNEHSM